MSVWWVFVILLGCSSSQTIQSQSNCTCNEKLRPTYEKVIVPCPNVTGETVELNLSKDQRVISQVECSIHNDTWNCTSSHELIVIKQNETFSFIVQEVRQGTYKCDGRRVFPPPLKVVTSKVKIQVLVRGHHCNSECLKHEIIWIWIIAVVLLIAYSLTITIIAFLIWRNTERHCYTPLEWSTNKAHTRSISTVVWKIKRNPRMKLRKTDCQNDYMNTKPRTSRDHRKRKGVQNPLPRY